MTHQPHKPPEGNDERHRDVMTRRGLLSKLFGGGKSHGEEVQPETPTPPAEKVARHTRSGFTRRTALATGAALAGALALGGLPTRPAHADPRGGWPGAFVERYQSPEWGPEELERLADAYTLLSGYRTNPSFWRYVTNHKMEGPVYEAIDAVLKHPELVHYKKEGDNVIRIIPRGDFSDLPPGLEIEISGGLPHGRITTIKINGVNLRIARASSTWEDYKDVVKGTTDEYLMMFTRLAGIDWIIRRPGLSPKRKLDYIKHWAKDLPSGIRKNFYGLIADAGWGIECSKTLKDTNYSDAKKIKIFQHNFSQLPQALQTALGPILDSKNKAADNQKITAIRTVVDEFNKFKAIQDFIKGLDIKQGNRAGYKTYNDYSEEMTGLPDRFKELFKTRRQSGYVDPATEDPARNPAMRTFLSGSNFIAYPFLDQNGGIVIKISTLAVEESGPNLNFNANPVIALSPDGRVMNPRDDNGDGVPDWEHYDFPGGKTTRDLALAKYKAELGLP